VSVGLGNGNGLLFHMTQPISRSFRVYLWAWQCLFFRQNADGNGLAGAIVPPLWSLAETK